MDVLEYCHAIECLLKSWDYYWWIFTVAEPGDNNNHLAWKVTIFDESVFTVQYNFSGMSEAHD